MKHNGSEFKTPVSHLQWNNGVGPWGRFVWGIMLASHNYGSAAERITAEAEKDGKRHTRFDRYTIRSWVHGHVPHPDTWPWIARACNVTLEDIAEAVERHRLWRYGPR